MITSYWYKKLEYLKTALIPAEMSAVIKNCCVYAGGAIFARAGGLVTMIFILKVISPHEYGIISLMNSVVSLTSALGSLGLRQALFVEYFHNSEEMQKKMVNEIIVIYLFCALPIFVFLYWLRHPLQTQVWGICIASNVFGTGLIIAFLFFFSELLYQLMRCKGQAVSLIIIQLSVALSTVIFSFFFIGICKWHITGYATAHLLSSLLSLGICVYAYMSYSYCRYINIYSSVQKTSFYLTKGLPFIPVLLSSWVLSTSDRWLLVNYISVEAVALYSLADTVAQLFNLILVYPCTSAYVPYILQQFAIHKQSPSLITRTETHNRRLMMVVMTIATICLVSIFFIAKPFLHLILPHYYYASLDYVLPLLIGQVFLLGTHFASNIIIFYKKSYFLTIGMVIAAWVNIVVSYVLIPYYGIAGCAQATCFAYVVYFFIIIFYSTLVQQRFNSLVS